MPANSIDARLFNVSSKQARGVLKPKLSAGRLDSKDSEDGYHSDDRDGGKHLNEGEPALCGPAAVALHLRVSSDKELPLNAGQSSSWPTTWATTVPPRNT